ncbi:MAG: AAA family ATPase [Methanomicrobiales archaeon]|nr:AAA family ATPase [Methanomicrobiales archaeon]
MLWIEKYRPKTLEEIAGQTHVTERLAAWADRRGLPHLLLSGPHGTGKSTAVECLAKRLYGDEWEVNTGIVSTSTLFQEGRAYLEGEERFSHLYRKDESVISNFKRIARWYSSLQPLGAPFRLMVFEEAEALPFEAQQALRRTMEQYHRTCRFLYCTTRASGIIPAIASRCYPLHFLPLGEEAILRILQRVQGEEGCTEVGRDDLELVARAAKGDARRAIMMLQVMAEAQIHDLSRAMRSETEGVTSTIVEQLLNGDLNAACKGMETLLLEYGLSGREAIHMLAREVGRQYNDPLAIRQIASTDTILAEGGNDFIQLNALLSMLREEVFP